MTFIRIIGLLLSLIPSLVLLWEGLAQFSPTVQSLGWRLVGLSVNIYPEVPLIILYYISGLPYTIAGFVGVIGVILLARKK